MIDLWEYFGDFRVKLIYEVVLNDYRFEESCIYLINNFAKIISIRKRRVVTFPGLVKEARQNQVLCYFVSLPIHSEYQENVQTQTLFEAEALYNIYCI